MDKVVTNRKSQEGALLSQLLDHKEDNWLAMTEPCRRRLLLAPSGQTFYRLVGHCSGGNLADTLVE